MTEAVRSRRQFIGGTTLIVREPIACKAALRPPALYAMASLGGTNQRRLDHDSSLAMTEGNNPFARPRSRCGMNAVTDPRSSVVEAAGLDM